jgi:lipopolysaccharide/colanic/teichoic acid biosynthesis glycosyltransferase
MLSILKHFNAFCFLEGRNMQAMALKEKYEKVTEEGFTEITLEALKEQKEGITSYPILDFDDRALRLLYKGVRETLKSSKVKVAGGERYEKAKRAFDVAASLCALGVLAVPMGLVALIIYVDDKGNPIFSQVRLTKDGRPFRMYKFRSMCVDAEAHFAEVQKQNDSDGIAFKSDDDPRITRVGKFIRKTSIDELPQLWNVLMGDMSIIGPRPPLPREVVLYTPEQMDRLLVKGGLACICQCEGRSDMPFDEWVESDIRYIKTRSALLDLKLIAKTAAAVILRKGAK